MTSSSLSRSDDAIRVAPEDDVAVALRDLPSGTMIEVSGAATLLREDIAKGHKLALRAIPKGGTVRKFGHPIGYATQAIASGSHVHSHNLETALRSHETYTFRQTSHTGAHASTGERFMGYRRSDGRVATRNEIWVIATVGCVAIACQKIAARASQLYAGQIDGIVAITHPFGCSQLGDDHGATRDILAALAMNPNAGGVVFVGLGCESNQLDGVVQAAPRLDPARVRTVRSQAVEDEVESGLDAIADLMPLVAASQRESVPLSGLVLGLKCGGSDGFSGLTANPLLGRLTDRVTAAGGAAILTEIPEIFGAETLLMQRAISENVFNRTAGLVNDFKAYFEAAGQPVHENPSPGNKQGGITTLDEKSLGAVQKGGHAVLSDVIAYAGRQSLPGLTLLEAPGNDAVSCTALAAAGATLVLFTTGRGTPLGCPVPTLKIASNSDLAARKPRWIDFDAGQVLEASDPAKIDDAFLTCVLETASGKLTRNEIAGERGVAIWKRGITL